MKHSQFILVHSSAEVVHRKEEVYTYPPASTSVYGPWNTRGEARAFALSGFRIGLTHAEPSDLKDFKSGTSYISYEKIEKYRVFEWNVLHELNIKRLQEEIT